MERRDKFGWTAGFKGEVADSLLSIIEDRRTRFQASPREKHVAERDYF